jgi:hypothetical protein
LGETGNGYKILVGKPGGKKPFVRIIYKLEDYIKIYFMINRLLK